MLIAEGRVVDSDGTALATNVFQVNAIVLGEPDPSFFHVPTEYQEVSPSEAFRLQLKVAGFEDWEIDRQVNLSLELLSKVDAMYFADAWPGSLAAGENSAKQQLQRAVQRSGCCADKN